jgi:hypothetical protein
MRVRWQLGYAVSRVGDVEAISALFLVRSAP